MQDQDQSRIDLTSDVKKANKALFPIMLLLIAFIYFLYNNINNSNLYNDFFTYFTGCKRLNLFLSALPTAQYLVHF
jgi:YbbR domain-containing protein